MEADGAWVGVASMGGINEVLGRRGSGEGCRGLGLERNSDEGNLEQNERVMAEIGLMWSEKQNLFIANTQI